MKENVENIKNCRFVIITGLSGAGKSIAMKSLEDLGFFCVDNMPPQLIPKFSEMFLLSQGKLSQIAFVVDIRGEIFFREIDQCLNELAEIGIQNEIIFLEAKDEVIVRRFSETRRKHPLQFSQSILENIQQERKKINELKSKATKIIDTSNLETKELKQEIQSFFKTGNTVGLHISLMSFGYKYGMPIDVDLIIDARFLPNPFYQNELSEYSGKDEKIRKYLYNFSVTKEFIDKFYSLIDFLSPYYLKEGKDYLSIAIGCTGGRHRSVFLVNELYTLLKNKDHQIIVKHRDIKKAEKDNKEKI